VRARWLPQVCRAINCGTYAWIIHFITKGVWAFGWCFVFYPYDVAIVNPVMAIARIGISHLAGSMQFTDTSYAQRIVFVSVWAPLRYEINVQIVGPSTKDRSIAARGISPLLPSRFTREGSTVANADSAMYVVGRRLSDGDDVQNDMSILPSCQGYDIYRVSNIRTELTPLTVIGYTQLPPTNESIYGYCYKCENDKYEFRPVESIMFTIIGIMFISVGFWHVMFQAARYGWRSFLIGLGCILTGWGVFGIGISPIIFHFLLSDIF
jgi:uncharacterized membrane protein